MKKKAAAKPQSNSLSTFFLYAGLVIFFIVISLSIKTFFVIKQSKFDGTHEFTIAVAKHGRVEEIIGFNPEAKSVSVMEFAGKSVGISSLGEQLGISPDAKV